MECALPTIHIICRNQISAMYLTNIATYGRVDANATLFPGVKFGK